MGQKENQWVSVGLYPKQHGNSAMVIFFRKKETQHKISVHKISRFIDAKSMFLQNKYGSGSSQASFPGILANTLKLLRTSGRHKGRSLLLCSLG